MAPQLYRDTQAFPSDERFGLTSQIRRAGVSIAANITEGQARVHTGDFIHHLSMARGSLAEVQTLLEIASGLEYLPRDRTRLLWSDRQIIGRMLTALIQSLEGRKRKQLKKHQPPTTSHQPPEDEPADESK